MESRKPLVTIASEREGLAVAKALGLRRVEDFRLLAQQREPEAGLYTGERISLLISGVLEHHMVAACALAFQALGRPSAIVNFGAAGSYRGTPGHPDGPSIGEVVMVERASRFDVDDNVHWAPPVPISVLEIGLPRVTCVTGTRYSTERDRSSPYFPGGEIEDMELYALAVLATTLELPLYSLKYVTNIVTSGGVEDFRKHVERWRGDGERALFRLLDRLSVL